MYRVGRGNLPWEPLGNNFEIVVADENENVKCLQMCHQSVGFTFRFNSVGFDGECRVDHRIWKLENIFQNP